MTIRIKKSGILDTFQDLGRNGFRSSGINPSGSMDKIAVRLLNTLLGNDENEAVLEMHFPACEIEFLSDAVFAIGGADFDVKLNKEPLGLWQNHYAKNGDVLSFTNQILGSRIYLAIKGGFELKDWLGSSSTNLTAAVGGLNGRALKKNDRIDFNKNDFNADSFFSRSIARSFQPKYSKTPTIRFVKGNEYKDLTALSEQVFLTSNFKISSNSNRMGFRLEGKPLHLLDEKELVSSAVEFGTVQLLPDGQMVILMADHQTTGGYPRIAHVIKQDLSLLAQLGSGDSVGFKMISHNEAEEVLVRTEKDLSFLKMGIRFAENSYK